MSSHCGRLLKWSGVFTVCADQFSCTLCVITDALSSGRVMKVHIGIDGLTYPGIFIMACTVIEKCLFSRTGFSLQ